MSININKYNHREDYLTDGNKPTDENCVSQIAQDIEYDPINPMLDAKQLQSDDVCLVFKELATGKILFVPIDKYVSGKIDSEKYELKNFVRFGEADGKQFLLYKNNASYNNSATMLWSNWNRYRLSCDTSDSGSFDWAITINGTAKSGSVSWSANDTLDSIVTQLNEGKVATYLVFSHEEGEDFIRVRTGGYSNSTFTLSNNTGVTLEDLSFKCKVNGVAQAESHRTWQAQEVRTLFPDFGYLPASTAQYAQSGINLSYRCGGNLAKYKSYYRTNGSATYISESTLSGRMSEAGFAALKDGDTDAVALYNKYNGSWDAYMEASMINIDDYHADGMEYRSYSNANEQSLKTASVLTEDFDGSWIPVYISAYAASQFSDEDFGTCCLPSNHEIALFMRDERFSKINTAISVLNGTALATNSYYWSAAEYNAYYAWCYYCAGGTVSTNGKYSSYSVRPTVLASCL